MALTDRDLEQVGRYVQAHLYEWLPTPVIDLSERIVRVEAELRLQRELMQQGFAQMEKRFEQVDKRFEEMTQQFEKRFEQIDKRFEQVDKRFEDMNHQLDKRFEQVDRRFDQVDKRFEDMNHRFNTLTWMIGVGFVVIATLMSLFAFFA